MDDAEVFLDDVLQSHAMWLRSRTPLTIHTDIRPTYVVGNGMALNRMVRALIDNAVRHAASTIELRVYRHDLQAVLVITDDGADERSWPPAGPELASTSAYPAGSGDGLELVTKVVANHGGTMTVGARDECGTTVTVTLPSSRQR